MGSYVSSLSALESEMLRCAASRLVWENRSTLLAEPEVLLRLLPENYSLVRMCLFVSCMLLSLTF